MIGTVLSAVLLALLVVLFIRDIRVNRAGLVFALRIVTIILMALVLCGFIFRKTVRQRPKADLLVLVDESQSMGVEHKAADAAEAVAHIGLKPQWRVELDGFGDTVTRLADPKSSNPDRVRTDFGQALRYARGLMPGAAVLVSDGVNNDLGDPAQLAQKLGFPVYTIGIGRKSVRDVAVERIRIPSRAVLGDTIPVGVRLSSRGFAGDRTRVRLFQDANLVDTRDVALSQDESEQELEFSVVPATAGRHTFRAVCDSMLGEDNYVNNSAQTVIDVLPSRTRVLYVTNEPGFGTGILLNLLRQDKDIELIPVVGLTGSSLKRIDHGMAAYPLGPQIDADVVILDNVDETMLGAQASDALLAFAANHGLLVLAGERLRAGRALSAVLPLEPTADRIARDLTLELTDDGRSVPILFEQARSLLSGMPPFWGAVRSSGLRDGAKLWAKAADGTPLMAFVRNGQGKVLEIAGYPLWRFGFSAGTVASGNDGLYRFLANAVRFLALKDVEAFSLSSDKLDYYAGEPISLVLQATSEDGRPWQGLDARLTIPDAKVSLAMTEQSAGLYEAVVQGLATGNYQAKADVSQSDKPLGSASHDFSVSELSMELTETSLHDDPLRRISAASGGEYVAYDSLSAKGLNIKFTQYRRLVVFDPRLNRYLFLLIAALFVLEIALRKRRGMM
jgi:hypothetical protein